MKDERQRLLRILAKHPAELEWPCRNEWIPVLIRDGLAKRTRDYQSHWGHGVHNCTTIEITDAGRKAITQ